MSAIVTWSTNAVPRTQRLDYFAAALSSALVPMQVEATHTGALASHMSMLEIDDVDVLSQCGSAHRSLRGRAELARSGAHTYHLIVNRRAAWYVEHAGATRVRAGQAFLIDSARANLIEMPSAYEVIHVKMPEAWLRRWVREPSRLVGRPLGGEVGQMDHALAAFVAGMTPHALRDGPLPALMMIDHLGAMLAMASGTTGRPIAASSAALALYNKVFACIANRSAESLLSPGDIANSLAIAESELHSVLASFGDTFASLLVTHRLANARRMLASRAFETFTVPEIALRAGFSRGADLTKLLDPGDASASDTREAQDRPKRLRSS